MNSTKCLAYKIEFQGQPYKFLKKLKDNDLKLRIKKEYMVFQKIPIKKQRNCKVYLKPLEE
ncbi:MAG: hypothetical protein LBM96_04285 [Methanobrevibacter sp.]|nr:hypothetical protein [Candidatus Methanoflexus mossambicus]